MVKIISYIISFIFDTGYELIYLLLYSCENKRISQHKILVNFLLLNVIIIFLFGVLCDSIMANIIDLYSKMINKIGGKNVYN